MKMTKKNPVVSGLLLGGLLFAGFSVTGQTGREKAVLTSGAKQEKKIRYRNYIWIEGEDAVATNFSREKTYNFFCSSKHALQLSKEADPSSDKGYYATYVFYVSRSKSYDLWMGCTPPGSRFADRPGYASPFDWKIDEGTYRKASAENVYVKGFYAPGSFYWTRVSTGTLAAGKHTLTVRVNQKRSSGWDYYFYIDAIVFFPTYGTDLVPLMKFPETAPESFTTRGKGITFKDAKTYEAQLKRGGAAYNVVFPLLQEYIWLYNYDKAIALCKTYLKVKPKDTTIRILLASCYAWSDQLDSAIREYKNIISIDPDNITARKLLAVLAGWNNRYDEAIRNYREIISIDPGNIDAYISLATQLSWKGEVEKSLAVFEKAESIAPDNIDVLYALGDNYNWSGKTAESVQKFRDIIAIDEKQILAYKKLAMIYLDRGDTAGADAVLKRAKVIQQLYPELAGLSLDVKGEKAKRTRATIDEYRDALAKNPDNLEARKNLIDTYRWNRMDREAFTEYNTLLNVKVYQRINITDSRVSRLQFEVVKFELVKPFLSGLREQVKKLSAKYKEYDENDTGEKTVPPGFTRTAVIDDYNRLKRLVDQTQLFERELSAFSDNITAYRKEVQNYRAQKSALGWEFEWERIARQARDNEKVSPQDYRPKKVIGLMELLYGNAASAVSNMAYVYKQAPPRAVPLYIYTLTGAGKNSEAERIIQEYPDPAGARRTDLQQLKQLRSYLEIIKKENDQERITAKKRGDLAQEIKTQANKADRKLKELIAEKDTKINKSREMIRELYEKGFLDMEYENVPVYKELGLYYLHRNDMSNAIYNYYHILQVQPQNVDINYTLGTMNESRGYKATALEHYELCINNQPTNMRARKSHYELQRDFSPRVDNNFYFFSDAYDGATLVTRMRNDLLGQYPFNDFFTMTAGFAYMQVKDKGGTTTGGQEYFASDGSATRMTGYLGGIINLVPVHAKLHVLAAGHRYSGEVDSSGSAYDSDIDYTSINYSGIVEFFPVRDMQVKIGYAYEDIAELTQSMKLDYRDAITAHTLSAAVDLAFSPFDFPMSDRLFFNDSLTYKMLSDDNTRTTWYNQLTFRALRLPETGMLLNVNAIYSTENSEFTEYNSGAIINLPYWAPEDIDTLAGGLRFEHTIAGLMNGTFSYVLEGQYNYDMVTYNGEDFSQSGFALGFGLAQAWAHISATIDYRYNTSTASTAGAKAYDSHEFRFGATGKIFSVYQPEGAGSNTLLIVSAEPRIITADGDGKDEYTTFVMTAFDERGIESWRIDIFNAQGDRINSLGRNGTPPPTFRWDGTDKAGNLLGQGSYYFQLSIVNSAGKSHASRKERLFLSRKKMAITLEAAFYRFSPNDDGVKDTVAFVIDATEKKSVRNWELSVAREKDRKYAVIRNIRGSDFMPYDIEWDGKDNSEKTVPDGKYYASLRVRFRDNDTVTAERVPVSVITKLPLSISTDVSSFTPGENKVVIRPLLRVREIDSWLLTIHTSAGRLVKEMIGSGDAPGPLDWDGKDDKGTIAGYNIPVTIQLEAVDRAGNRARSNRVTVWLGNYVKKDGDKTVIVLFDQGILHKRKQAAFSREADEVIRKLADRVKSIKRSGAVNIRAHTSTDGSVEENIKLSEQRAKQLAEQMSKLLKGYTFSSQGVGESRPFGSKADEKWDVRYEIEIR